MTEKIFDYEISFFVNNRWQKGDMPMDLRSGFDRRKTQRRKEIRNGHERRQSDRRLSS